MLLPTLIFQVAATAVYGIITQQSPQTTKPTPVKFENDTHPTTIKFQETSTSAAIKFKEDVAPRPVRKINLSSKYANWKTILKDAAFQSLIKHTGFTPSLEEKMESDRLLWEKLQAAKFYRKNTGKSDEGNEQVRMGVLLDMTSEAGSLEFRQSDRSVYTCPDSKCEDILKRLLAIWKMEKFEPNDTWIRIKVPRHGKEEDVYEYTPKHGLQQMNGKFSPVSTSNESKSVADDPTYSEEIPVTPKAIIDERVAKIERRIDLGIATPRKLAVYEVKHVKPKDFAGSKSPVDFTKYNPYLARKLVSQPIKFVNPGNMNKKNVVYKVKPVEGSVIKIEPNVLREFQIGDVYEGFIPSLGPTGSPYTTTMNYGLQFSQNYPSFTEYETNINHDTGRRVQFKPSPEFNQYSEPDPIYHEPGIVQREPESLPKGLKEIVSNVTTMRKTTWEPGTSRKTTLKQGRNTTRSEASLMPPHAELTDSSIRVAQFADAKGNAIDITTKPTPKREDTKPKNQLKSIFRPSSEEVQDYAPLYVKWGEKLRTTIPPNKVTDVPDVTATTLDFTDTTDVPPTTPKTNMFIENITDKSPEEIVNTLTNLGVVNTTRIEGYPPVSEKTLAMSSKILEKIAKGQKSSLNDPISLIVNRISQSYSYRTSNGKVKNFKKMRRHNN